MPRKTVTDADRQLAANTKARRLEADLTQQDLAVAVGCHASSIYWLERDGRCSIELLRKIATELDCTPGDLLG